MIGLRYHITSTVAIFIALGLGIFLGSAIVKDDTLARHQESLISRIESEFTLLRKDRDALYARLMKTESLLEDSLAFGEKSLTGLICGKLEDKRVALVVPGRGLSYDEVNAVTATLRSAGASLSQVVYITKRLEPITSEDTRELAEFCGIAKPSSHVVGQALADSIAVLAIQRGTSCSPAVDALLQSDYLEIDLYEQAQCNAVIIAGGSNDPAHTPLYTDIPIIKAFQRLNMPAVLVESGSVDFSFITEYAHEGIPTIEQVDTPMGRFSLIEQLAKSINGD
jgi:hypothetical protein